MIEKKFGEHFHSEGGALTLPAYEVGCGNFEGYSSKTHSDGWTISGEVIVDYLLWVNDFEARHPIFGRVWGNFEKSVFADSEEGFADFYKKHEPEAWDYADV